MKKFFAIALSFIALTIIVTMASTPSGKPASKGTPNTVMASAIPDSVSSILEKSCYPCHSEPGKSMAMSKVNFDKWDSYKPEKQADKAEDICKEMKKGGMPPKSFRSNNPDKVPTETEVRIICNWAASFPQDK